MNALQKAKNKASNVKKYIRKYNNQEGIDIDLKGLSEARESGKNIELLLDIETGRIQEFCDNLEKNIYGNHLVIKNKIVRIDCYLPTIEEPLGACLFQFNLHYLRDAMISMNHFSILEKIYPYHNIPFELRDRKFFLKGTGPFQNTCVIDIGPVRFNMTNEETKSFVLAVDELIKEYIKAMMDVEVKKTTLNLAPYNKELKNFIIAKSDECTWDLCKAFIYSHDYEAGNDIWNIFDAPSECMIKVFDKKKHQYKCFININGELNYLNKVHLNYCFLDFNTPGHDELWSPEECQSWLVDDFFPAVKIWWMNKNKKSKFNNKNKSIYYGEIRMTYNIILDFDFMTTYEEYASAFYSLYDFSNNLEYIKIRVQPLMKLYTLIYKEFERRKSPNIEPYVLSDIKDDHNQIINCFYTGSDNENEEAVYRGYMIGKIFLNIHFILKFYGFGNYVSSTLRKEIQENLEEVVLQYNINETVNKILKVQ